MQHVLTFYKAINKQEVQHRNFYQLEHIALQLAQIKTSKFETKCVGHKDSANQVIQQLNQGGGCSLNAGEFYYRYFIEELGDFPCLGVQEDQKHCSIRHRRVTLILISEENPSSLLQIRYLTPIKEQPGLTERQIVSGGLSSWRYLSDLSEFRGA